MLKATLTLKGTVMGKSMLKPLASVADDKGTSVHDGEAGQDRASLADEPYPRSKVARTLVLDAAERLAARRLVRELATELVQRGPPDLAARQVAGLRAATMPSWAGLRLTTSP